MKHAFVNNGETQLVLIPTDDLERLLLKKITGEEMEVTPVAEQVNLLGLNLSGSLIIRKRVNPINGTSQIEVKVTTDGSSDKDSVET